MNYGVTLSEGDINIALTAILGSMSFLVIIALVLVWALASQVWDTLFETLNVLVGGRVAGGRGLGSFGGTAGVNQIHLPGGGGGFHGSSRLPGVSGSGGSKFSLRSENSGLGGGGSSSFSGQIHSIKSGTGMSGRGGVRITHPERLMTQEQINARAGTSSRRGGVNHE